MQINVKSYQRRYVLPLKRKIKHALSDTSFEIKLPLFEGPFDLLLFFIERDELEIEDIPIAKVTDDFLAYIHQLEHLNIDVASDFILVAASLMRIKAKMLLPRQEVNDKGEEIDPRDELVKHLLEYKKYKDVLAELAALEAERLERYERGNVLAELESITVQQSGEMELHSLDMYKLVKVFQKVLLRYEAEQNKPQHIVHQYPFTIEGQKQLILYKLEQTKELAFDAFILESASKIAAVFSFLAILELLQLQQIGILQGEGFNQFWLTPFTPEVDNG